MKKGNTRELAAQELIHVEEIRDKLLWTTDQYLFAYIRVAGHDNSLLDEMDNVRVTDQITTALAEERKPWQLLSVPRAVDTQGMIRELTQMLETSDTSARTSLIEGELKSLKAMVDRGDREPLLILKVWEKAAPGIDRTLEERVGQIQQKLNENSIAARRLKDQEIRHLCAIYAELGIWQDTDVTQHIPLLPNRKGLRKNTPEVAEHISLMREITPVGGVFFEPLSCMIGSACCKCMAVTRYPEELPYNWAAPLMGLVDCVTCITYHPASDSAIGDALSRTIREANRDAEDERDARRRKRLERKAESADHMIDELDAKGMTLGQLSIVLMPFAADKETLEQVCKAVTSRYAARRMRVKVLSHLQKEAFMHLSPYYPAQEAVEEICQRVAPLETLTGGYPMTVSLIRDDRGLYFGRTKGGGMLAIDITCRTPDRTNGNGIVSGKPGTGKSTALKHMLESMYMQGVKIIIIDPETEYRDLCKNLGGSWWSAGGGGAKVNLLQVAQLPPDDEEDPAYRADPRPLAQHMQTVETILQYRLPDITATQMALLKRELLNLYTRFGIMLELSVEELTKYKATDFPIMEDLYKQVLEAEKSASGAEQTDYHTLALLLEEMSIGADKEIWNGHTGIDFSGNLICIDTHSLYNGSRNNRLAQYYNLILLAWQAMSADKTAPCLLLCDECQVLFDPQLPQVTDTLKNIALRCRKYEGYFWLVFHSMQELLHESVRRNGQAIVDAAAYKLLFGTDGKNLQDTVDLFGLTVPERKIMEAVQQRKALAMIGSSRIQVEFDIPDYKLRLMGKGGGR